MVTIGRPSPAKRRPDLFVVEMIPEKSGVTRFDHQVPRYKKNEEQDPPLRSQKKPAPNWADRWPKQRATGESRKWYHQGVDPFCQRPERDKQPGSQQPAIGRLLPLTESV